MRFPCGWIVGQSVKPDVALGLVLQSTISKGENPMNHKRFSQLNMFLAIAILIAACGGAATAAAPTPSSLPEAPVTLAPTQTPRVEAPMGTPTVLPKLGDVNTHSVSITVKPGETVELFTLTSISVFRYTLYGYPCGDVRYSMYWLNSTGGITPGETTSARLQVNHDAVSCRGVQKVIFWENDNIKEVHEVEVTINVEP